MKKAILLSGGIDSISLTYWKQKNITLAITIDYGQKSADIELEVSRIICSELKLKHEIIRISSTDIGCGEMHNNNKKLSISPADEWWPFRNQYLITIGSMKAIEFSVSGLLIGSVKQDAKFTDGTARFYKNINKLFKEQEGSLTIEVPAINLSSLDLVKISKIPMALLLNAHSCHKSNIPCGCCNGCLKYIDVMERLKADKYL